MANPRLGFSVSLFRILASRAFSAGLRCVEEAGRARADILGGGLGSGGDAEELRAGARGAHVSWVTGRGSVARLIESGHLRAGGGLAIEPSATLVSGVTRLALREPRTLPVRAHTRDALRVLATCFTREEVGASGGRAEGTLALTEPLHVADCMLGVLRTRTQEDCIIEIDIRGAGSLHLARLQELGAEVPLRMGHRRCSRKLIAVVRRTQLLASRQRDPQQPTYEQDFHFISFF